MFISIRWTYLTQVWTYLSDGGVAATWPFNMYYKEIASYDNHNFLRWRGGRHMFNYIIQLAGWPPPFSPLHGEEGGLATSQDYKDIFPDSEDA